MFFCPTAVSANNVIRVFIIHIGFVIVLLTITAAKPDIKEFNGEPSCYVGLSLFFEVIVCTNSMF